MILDVVICLGVIGLFWLILYGVGIAKSKKNGDEKFDSSILNNGVDNSGDNVQYKSRMNFNKVKSTLKTKETQLKDKVEDIKKSMTPLAKLHQKLQSKFETSKSDLRCVLNQKHITVIQNHKKVAMITLDNSQKIGERKLGDVTIFNFHKAPSESEVLEKITNL